MNMLTHCVLTMLSIILWLNVILTGTGVKKCVSNYFLKRALKKLEPEYLCSICLESINSDSSSLSDVYRLPCSHWFHKECIYPWLSDSGSCPNCRHRSCLCYANNVIDVLVSLTWGGGIQM